MQTVFAACNKRDPGSGCAARHGFNREHAIFGASADCVAINPSDMAVALAVLDAVVHVQNETGGGAPSRSIGSSCCPAAPRRSTTRWTHTI